LGYSFDVEVSGCDENEGQREIMNGGAHNYDITLLGKVIIMWKVTDTQVSRQNPFLQARPTPNFFHIFPFKPKEISLMICHTNAPISMTWKLQIREFFHSSVRKRAKFSHTLDLPNFICDIQAQAGNI